MYRGLRFGKGYFFGSVCKMNNIPDGYGVFKTGDWVHCGKVQDNCFIGRQVSANAKAKLLKLLNTKVQSDGSVL